LVKKKKLAKKISSFLVHKNVQKDHADLIFDAISKKNFKMMADYLDRFLDINLEQKDALGNTMLNSCV